MTTPTTTVTQAAVTRPRKSRKPPRDLSAHVPGLNLDARLVAPGEDWARPSRTVTRKAKPRGEQLKKLDSQAADLYRRWVAAGSPRDMDKSPKAEYTAAPEHVDDLTALLRKTADKAGGAPGKSIKIRQETMESGKIAVTVAVWDRLES
jgi:hypothetical protein